MKTPCCFSNFVVLASMLGGLSSAAEDKGATDPLTVHSAMVQPMEKVSAPTDGPAYAPHAKGTLTFTKDIAPVVFNNCSACHRPGEVAPFSLLNFMDVKKHAKQIADITSTRVMPPWKAEPGHGEFMDMRRLTNEQIGMIGQWVDEGCAEGKPEDLPALPKFTDGWTLGEPDLILKVPEAYTLKADGRDELRCFVIPIPIAENKFVRAIEFRPGNRKVVHHAILYLDGSGAARKKDEADPKPGYASLAGPGIIPSGSLGGWAPGSFPHFLPDGIARNLKKGNDLVLQIHYHPDGKEEVDQSSVGLYFSKDTNNRVLMGLPMFNRKIDIPAGEKNYVIKDSITVPVDVEAIGIVPHAHYLAKDMRVDATLPDGKKIPLLWISDWDFNWQDQYLYKNKIKLPKDTKIDLTYVYDNSADNIHNPSSPPKRVHFGEQTTDEMALLVIQVVPERKEDALILLASLGRRFLSGFAGNPGAVPDGQDNKQSLMQAIIKRFDTNGDGKLDDDERAKAWEEIRKWRGKE